MKGVLTMGEVLATFYPDRTGPLRDGVRFSAGIAGAEATVAIGLRRLGVPVTFLSRFGDDPFTTVITDRLRAEGITILSSPASGRRNGLLIAEKRTAASTRITYWRQDSAASTLSPSDLDAVDWDSVAMLHITGITAALSPSTAALVRHAMRSAQDHAVHVSLDVNHRRGLWSDDDARSFFAGVIEYADTVFSSRDELHLLSVTRPAALVDRGVSEVVITDGPRGAEAWSATGEHASCPTFATEVVSTVGAGDAFVSGYLAARCTGRPLADRLRAGSVSAAYCVACEGDWEGLPTEREATAFAQGAADIDR